MCFPILGEAKVDEAEWLEEQGDRYGRSDDDYYRRDMSSDRNDRLYDDDYDDYIDNDDYAGRDCSAATQITRLPDGTEIRRTVDACRDAYYGGWKVRD